MPRIASNRVYKCTDCEYSSMRKSSLTAHRNRKRSCVISSVPDEGVDEDPCINECEHCKKRYTTNKSLLRHLKTCKKIPTIEQQIDSPESSSNSPESSSNSPETSTVDKKTHTCEFCSKSYKSRQGLYMHLKRGCKSPNYRNSPISDNPDEQRTPFKKFGREAKPLLTEAEWTDICRLYSFPARCKGMATIIQEIWFNPSTPENHNVRFRNIKSKYMEIWNGERWVLELKDWVVRQMMDSTAELVYEYTKSNDYYLRAHDNYLERFTQVNFDRCNEVIACVHDGKNPEKYRFIRSRMYTMIYNCSKSTWMWAAPANFDRSAILKCHAAAVVTRNTAKRLAGEKIDYQTLPYIDRARKITEDEIARRVKAALLKHGMAEDVADTESKNATDEFKVEIHRHLWGNKPMDYKPHAKCKSRAYYLLQLNEDRPEHFRLPEGPPNA